MSYNANIPQATDIPSQSQAQILANFQQIATAFNLNHLDFNAVGQGKHDFVELPVKASVPTGLAAAEVTVYAKTVTAISQLFMTRDSAGVESQITGIPFVNSGGNYMWKSPFGLQLAFGTFTASSSAAVITFADSGFTTSAVACIAVQIDVGAAGSKACTVHSGTLTITGVTINTSNSTSTGYYLALGA